MSPTESLVKYDNPKLVSTTNQKTLGRSKAKKLPPVLKPKDSATLATEDILNQILPPREWAETGQLWVQYVSSAPSTRVDVLSLHQELDRRLQQRQARETGLCPTREELYAQCFDEIIRQVTVSCAERGLLLLRIRDELRMRMNAYQTLYESSVAFAMRKPLQALQTASDMEAKIAQLEMECRDLDLEKTREAQRLEETTRRLDVEKKRWREDHSKKVTALNEDIQRLMDDLAKALDMKQDDGKGGKDAKSKKR